MIIYQAPTVIISTANAPNTIKSFSSTVTSTASTVSSVLSFIKLDHPGVKSHTLISNELFVISQAEKASGVIKKYKKLKNRNIYVKRNFIAERRGKNIRK